jgi:hypothetical protein
LDHPLLDGQKDKRFIAFWAKPGWKPKHWRQSPPRSLSLQADGVDFDVDLVKRQGVQAALLSAEP